MAGGQGGGGGGGEREIKGARSILIGRSLSDDILPSVCAGGAVRDVWGLVCCVLLSIIISVN